MLEAGKTATTAQRYAEIVCNTLSMMGYDEVKAQGRRVLTEIEGAAGWESEIALGAEKEFGGGNRQRIATVRIYKSGETLARCTQEVPISSKSGGFPKGTILPFMGELSAVPKGWRLCDGTNGTPDLRDRFLMGAGLSYAPNQIGGKNAVSLKAENLPPNAFNNSFGNKYLLSSMTGTYTFGTIENAALITHSQHGTNGKSGFNWIQVGNAISSANWQGKPVNTLPAYYTVYFIIKI